MRDPLCPYFGRCGGCSTQHLPYDVQLNNKRQTVARAAGVPESSVQVFSGNEWHYRNRMDFVFTPDGLGFREKGSWNRRVTIDRCVISDERLNGLLTEVREAFKEADPFDPKKCTGTYRYAVIRTPQQDSSISFVLNSDSTRVEEALHKIQAFAQKTAAKNVIVTYVPSKTDQSISEDFFVVKGQDMLEETLLGKRFRYSVQGFFQNNSAMAETMQAYVRRLFESHSTTASHLLDLYGGVGTFGILNADLFKGVSTVESFPGCVEAAQANIVLNGVSNVQAVCLDAMRLKNLELPTPLYVLTDPPRSGMHPKTILRLNELKPRVIVYISCNVAQLEKDVPKFKDYRVKSAALFDLFPQTNHMEAVVELALNRAS